MSREAIEVGAFTWSRIQRLYDPDTITHWQRCESESLQCPQEVFTQLFHEQANNEDFAVVVRSIDYSAPSASPLAQRSGPRALGTTGNLRDGAPLRLPIRGAKENGWAPHQPHPAEETVGTGPRYYALYSLIETSDTAISAGACVNFVRCQAMETTSFAS